MGNTISSQSSPLINIEQCLKEIKEIEFIERVKINRYIKTVSANYKKEENRPQQSIIKIYSYSPADYAIIQDCVQNLQNLNKLFYDCVFLLTYSPIFVTDKICVAVRSRVQNNLYDRLSTRPFLCESEKMWLVYQLLRALAYLHCYFAHGDLKLENILITSWGFLILSDLSIIVKPTYICEDTLVSEFNYFFDTSGRRSCYIAPERITSTNRKLVFYSKESELNINESRIRFRKDTPILENISLVPSMDIFSLGCVIYQIFSDNKYLFTLSDLVSFYRNELSLDRIREMIKNNIKNPVIADMIISMVCSKVEDRLTASDYLKFNELFPPFFSYLYDLSLKLATIQNSIPELFIFLIKKEIPTIINYFQIYNDKYSVEFHESGLNFVLNVVTSALPKLTQSKFKIDFLEIVLEISAHVSSDIILHQILSHVIYLVDDACEQVKKLIPYFLVEILNHVKTLPVTYEVNMFSDYVLQNLSILQNDPSIIVRMHFSSYFPRILSEALRFFSLSQVHIESQFSDKQSLVYSSETELESIYNIAYEINKQFLIDSSFFIKFNYITESLCDVLVSLTSIMPFESIARDAMLSHVISILNNKEAWNLRECFYKILPKIISFFDSSCISVVMPLLAQGLIDPCEWVIISFLDCIKTLYNSKLIPVEANLFSRISVLMIHPNPLIRHSSVKAIADILHSQNTLVVHSQYLPILNPYLIDTTLGAVCLSFNSLVSNVISPIPFNVFDLFLNKKTSHKFLKFLKKFETSIFDTFIPQTTHCEEFLEADNEFIVNFFKILESRSFITRLDMIKLLLMSDFFKIFTQEKPLPKLSTENHALSLGHSTFSFDSAKKSQLIDLSVDTEFTLFSDTSSLSSIKSKLIEPPVEKAVDMFNSFISQNYLTSRQNLCEIIQKYKKVYDTYSYAVDYCKNRKFKFVSRPLGRIRPLRQVSSFKPHTSTINRLSCVDSGVFSTASDDCCVKMFDVSQLDHSKYFADFEPIYEYNQMSGRVNVVKNMRIHTNYSFLRVACASSDDSDIQVFDVIQTKKSKKHPFHRCIVDLNNDGFVVDLSSNNIYSNPVLLAATLHGSVLGFDIREVCQKYSLKFNSKADGFFTALECDPYGCWVAASTNQGTIYLWDMRLPSFPIKSISSPVKSPISRLAVDCTNFKKIICGYENSAKPVAIFNLETSQQESCISTYSRETSCTGFHPINVDGVLHVYFCTTDGSIRDWTPHTPHKSSILVPSVEIKSSYSKMNYSTRSAVLSGPLETKESLLLDPVDSYSTKYLYPDPIHTFCTDILYMRNNDLLVTSTFDGSIIVFK